MATIQTWAVPNCDGDTLHLRNLLIEHLSRQGYQVKNVEMITQLELTRPTLWFGGHLMSQTGQGGSDHWIGNPIIIQTADLTVIETNPVYRRALTKYPVWEISKLRFEVLQSLPIKFKSLNLIELSFPIEEYPSFDHEYEVLYWGAPNRRQQYFINRLIAAGIHVEIDREQSVRSLDLSKMVVMINDSDNGNFNPVILRQLIIAGKTVIAESSTIWSDKWAQKASEERQDYGSGICWTVASGPEEMAKTIKWLLLHPEDLKICQTRNCMIRGQFKTVLPLLPEPSELAPLWDNHVHIITDIPGLSRFEIEVYKIAALRHFREVGSSSNSSDSAGYAREVERASNSAHERTGKSLTISYGDRPIEYALNYVLIVSDSQRDKYSTSYRIEWLNEFEVIDQWFNYEPSKLFVLPETDLGIVLIGPALTEQHVKIIGSLQKSQEDHSNYKTQLSRIEIVNNLNNYLYPPRVLLITEFRSLIWGWAERLQIPVVVTVPIPDTFHNKFANFRYVPVEQVTQVVLELLEQYDVDKIRQQILGVTKLNEMQNHVRLINSDQDD
jgi:hypothetical protein